MEQNTPEWLAWRRTGIGASDTPKILGLSTHGDMLDVFIEKVYGVENEDTYILNKGHEIEEQVRANYQITGDGDFPKACRQKKVVPTKNQRIIESIDDKEWLLASADGWNEEKRIGLEIKYTGEENMNPETEVPMLFRVQCWQQIDVFDANGWILLMSNDGVNIRKEPIELDKREYNKIKTKLRKFQERVEKYRATRVSDQSNI